MSDQQVPSTPDYSPIVNAFNSIASTAGTNGANSLKWAQDQVANNKNLTDQVNNGLVDTQGTYDAAGKQRLDSSGKMISAGDQNLKDQYAKYTDPTRVQSDMGAAEANVGQAFDAARNASTQELESYGVNPSATRFGALDIGVRTQAAAAKAGAGNVAARTDAQLADQTNQEILNQGNAETGQATNLTSTGNTAGVGAVSNNLANTASGANVLGTGLQWTGAQTGALGGASSTMNTGFQNSADAAKISNSSSSGLGSLLGAGLGALGKGGAFASGGALAAFLADGGAVPDGPQAAPGGPVPVSASPSRGAVTDDVTAQGPSGLIRLNGGEFVIPKDVTRWEGEKSFQNLIQKARLAKQQASAQPAIGPAVGPAPQRAVG